MDEKVKFLSCLTVLFLVLATFSAAAVISERGDEYGKEVGSIPENDPISSHIGMSGIRSDEEPEIQLEGEDNELRSSGFVLKSDTAWKNATGDNPIINMYGSMGNAIGYGDITADDTTEIITGSNDFNTDFTDPIDQRSLRVWVYDEGTEELELQAERIPDDLASISSISTGPTGSGYIVTGGQDESEPPRSDLRLWSYEGGSLNLLDEEQWIDDGYNNTINSVALRDINSDGNLEIVTGGLSRFDDDDDKSKAQITIWTIEEDSSLSLRVKEEWVSEDQTGVGTVRIADLGSDGTYQIISGGWTAEDDAEVRVWQWEGEEMILLDSIVWTEGQGGVLDIDTADMVGDGKPEIVTSGANEQLDGTAAEVAVLSYDDGALQILDRGRYFVNPQDMHGDTVGVSVDVVDGNLDGELDIIVSGLTEGPHPGGTTFWGIMMACSFSEGQLTQDTEHYWLEDDQTMAVDQITTDLIEGPHPEIVQIGSKALTENSDQEYHARVWKWNYMEEEETHTLTIEVGEGGTTDPSPGSHTYNEGEEVTVEAIPDEGWMFGEWTGDFPPGEGEEEEITITMDEDKSLAAYFERESYFEVDILDHDDSVLEGEQVVVDYTVENTGEEEDTQTIEFTVDGTLEDSEELTLGSGDTHDDTFTWQTQEGDAGDYVISVASEDDVEEVTVTVLEEGIFNVDIIEYDQEVMEGQEVMVDYRITNTGETEDTQTIEFTVNGDVEDTQEVTLAPEEIYEDEFTWQTEIGDAGEHDIAVVGEDDDDEVTVTVTELEDVYFEIEIVEPTEGSEYAQGDEVILEYTVTNIGETEDTQTIEFTVDGVFEDSEEVTLGSDQMHEGEFLWNAEDIGDYILAVASEDDEDDVTVNVVEDTVEYELTIYAENGGTTDPQPGVYVHEEDTEVTVEAVHDEGWEFSHWEGDHPEGDQEEAEIEVMMDSDKTLTAHFEEEEPVITYELTIDSTEGGEVIEPGEDTYEHDEGETVELEAIHHEGYVFSGWTGEIENVEDTGSNETTIEMLDDYAITAEFEEEVVEHYELTVNIEGQGDVYIDPDQEEYEEGTEVLLESIAFEGWQFVEWTGDHESTDEEITVTMDGDKEITAHFAEQASFEVSMISPEDGDEFEKGEEVVVRYEVENTGGVEGTQDVEFVINGELIETEEDVRLGPGESDEGYFIWEAEDEGEIELVVRSVDDEEAVAISVEDTIPYWLIIPILLIAVGLIAALLLLKNKKEKEE